MDNENILRRVAAVVNVPAYSRSKIYLRFDLISIRIPGLADIERSQNMHYSDVEGRVREIKSWARPAEIKEDDVDRISGKRTCCKGDYHTFFRCQMQTPEDQGFSLHPPPQIFQAKIFPRSCTISRRDLLPCGFGALSHRDPRINWWKTQTMHSRIL